MQTDHKPTLDVIIPCYNAAATLRAAAESALAQSRVRTVWLVDDASQDDTAEVMSQLAAQYPQIRCACLPQNGGAAQARNWGVLQSDADFAAFLDADDAYETEALAPAYLALETIPYLALVRLKLRPAGFPDHYTAHPAFAEAWQRLEMTVGGNMVFRRSVLLACGGFPQDALFRRFGGEDAALGIALTRAAVVGTLFGDNDPAVIHNHRPGIHAEKLLDAALFGKIPDGMTAQHQAEAEAVTQRICAAVEGLKTTLSFGQTGITALQTDYGGEN